MTDANRELKISLPFGRKTVGGDYNVEVTGLAVRQDGAYLVNNDGILPSDVTCRIDKYDFTTTIHFVKAAGFGGKNNSAVALWIGTEIMLL